MEVGCLESGGRAGGVVRVCGEIGGVFGRLVVWVGLNG